MALLSHAFSLPGCRPSRSHETLYAVLLAIAGVGMRRLWRYLGTSWAKLPARFRKSR
jgi:hypothetical protein